MLRHTHSRACALPAFLAREPPSPRVLRRFSSAARKLSTSSLWSVDGVIVVAARDKGSASARPARRPLFTHGQGCGAGVLNRHSRAAELSARAALKAEALLGDDSLVVAHQRMNESTVLANLAATASGAEQGALCRRSWGALLSVVALLQRRLASDSFLPGTVREEESDYYGHVQAAIFAAHNDPVPQPAELQDLGSMIGCSVLLGALFRSLNFLDNSFQSVWPDAQRKIVESFVRALSSPLLVSLTLVPTGASLFRYFKPWISYLEQPV